VRALIGKQKESGWEFLFLGANIDAAREAARFGIHPDRAVDYRADRRGTRVIYETVSETLCDFRASKPMTAGWKKKIERDFRDRS
jgi:hypothetical protein